jgi:Patatin-like phospholipase
MNQLPASRPQLECDLVMKGGITSGVIYPKLIATLSKVYRFRSIGGTSAGAIAAGAAAAAQLCVHAQTNPDAFRLLERLPDQLGAPAEGKSGSLLLNLFQPQPKLSPHFTFLTAGLNAKSSGARLGQLAIAAVLCFPLGAVLGAAPGIVLTWHTWGIGWLIGVLVTLVGAVAGGVIAALLSFGRYLPGNHFGLCTGMPTTPGATPKALTPWLHQYLNQLAGKKGNAPLTFGELWQGSIRTTAGEPERTDAPVVQLDMITTALNLGRPYRIPFESGDIYYVEEELRSFFPAEVMQWLVEHARPSETATMLSRQGSTFHALPTAADFPVLLGVRLSLSFPILLSALPLYTVDRTLDVNKDKPTRATRVYFSDGGISSNFPVHFFDRPLPSRPTFGVNLKPFHPDHPTERVFLPEMLRNNTGLRNYCPPLPDAPGWGSIAGFLSAIASTTQNWRDQLQLSMPGFRDRIVHVSHSESEGGLNLDMPAEVITTLANSGGAAADALIAAFAVGGGLETPNGWDNHRRIRARALLNALQQQLRQIADALDAPLEPSYDEVILNETPPSYRFPKWLDATEGQRLLHELQRLSQELAANSVDFSEEAPRPAPEVRLVPRT